MKELAKLIIRLRFRISLISPRCNEDWRGTLNVHRYSVQTMFLVIADDGARSWRCARRHSLSSPCGIPAPDEPTLARGAHADTGSHVQANKEDRPTSRPWGGAPRTRPQLILRHWARSLSLAIGGQATGWMTDEENAKRRGRVDKEGKNGTSGPRAYVEQLVEHNRPLVSTSVFLLFLPLFRSNWLDCSRSRSGTFYLK